MTILHIKPAYIEGGIKDLCETEVNEHESRNCHYPARRTVGCLLEANHPSRRGSRQQLLRIVSQVQSCSAVSSMTPLFLEDRLEKCANYCTIAPLDEESWSQTKEPGIQGSGEETFLQSVPSESFKIKNCCRSDSICGKRNHR